MLNASGRNSYVLCEVAAALYAVPSDSIEQLEMIGHITPVPNTAHFVDGVTSVRGKVLPVVSLRSRFGFPRIAHDLRSRLVVVRWQQRTVALVVDAAREFAAIPEDAIQPPPEGLADLSSRYLRGLAHLGDRLVLVLDVGALFDNSTANVEHSAALLPASA
ncbi:MAG: chemotaxis protein CheW [Gemmatimonadaceae bacterium]